MRRLLFILDGLCESPKTVTTMEMARTPFLDELAQRGWLAFLDLQPESGTEEFPTLYPPSSERGILRLLGFPQEEPLPPRATLLSCLFPHAECEDGSMAILLNPACYDSDGRLKDYVGDRESIGRLWAFFDSVEAGDYYHDRESGLRIYPLREARKNTILRLLVRIPQKMASSFSREDFVSPSLGKKYPRSDWAQWLLEKITHTTDVSGRLNGFWPWGAGPWHTIVPLTKPAPSGGVMIAGAPIARAIGAYMGLEHPFVPGASGETDTDFPSIMRFARRYLADGISPVVVHIEGFDLASHRKNREEKQSFLERFDREASRDLLSLLESGEVDEVFLTSDHRSNPETGEHGAGPVPVLIVTGNKSFNQSGTTNGVRFTEAIAEKESQWDLTRWQKIWKDSAGEMVVWH
ncbi:alkaline phosphatase family protein [Leptospirillum ferrooxidans]|uniref:Putative phosphoglycerate mutase n=1 Tax=Leptospirillum ferrooxidans (strain C2-3) TaxID=1162668 RepID=I0ING7_LEPFC|nr:phosphoglycerate mutase [Leptospirillum ferrooxidans]BAM06816.1 putative phosphoglycerate mutase [Leptospirillum ferrooxidans C2-3]